MVRTLSAALLLPLLALAAPLAQAVDVVPLNIKRIDRDHYETTDELIHIITKNCMEDAYVDDAVLTTEPYGLDNTLLFRNTGITCHVKMVYDRPASRTTNGKDELPIPAQPMNSERGRKSTGAPGE